MRKRSPLWKQETLIRELASTCTSKSQMLAELGYTRSPGNYTTLEKISTEFGIDLPVPGTIERSLKACTWDLEDILVANSTYTNTTSLKKRILKEGLLEYKCQECGLEDSWNNKTIKLQLDHINGNNKDHRIENLRFLCPNCHSQTVTFCRGQRWMVI